MSYNKQVNHSAGIGLGFGFGIRVSFYGEVLG